MERGYKQIGTLGSGNHYLEIQVVKPENVFDAELARTFGITLPNQVVVMFHCGSRGFGHQVATDYLQLFLKVMEKKYGIRVLDRELACAPFQSPEGQDYFAAMKCAINMSYANRQVILHRIREVFSEVFRKSPEHLGMHQVYDVAHNTAKLEQHRIDGDLRDVLVHRKGATRAFGPGMPDLPEIYKKTGQPVIIGGSMESGSYLLVGVSSGDQTFYSTAHGSGRSMSRHAAKKRFRGKQLQQDMEARGIYVRTTSFAGLAEEAGAGLQEHRRRDPGRCRCRYQQTGGAVRSRWQCERLTFRTCKPGIPVWQVEQSNYGSPHSHRAHYRVVGQRQDHAAAAHSGQYRGAACHCHERIW